jgi:ectoine hydroxylase-related dioxygenase (phytanoyl-CoA dioxygenase family)
MDKLTESKKIKVEGNFLSEGYLILRSFFDAYEIESIYDALRKDEISTISKIKNLIDIGKFNTSDVGIDSNSLKYLKNANIWFHDLSKLINLSLMEEIGKVIGNQNYIKGLELHQKLPGVSGTPPHQDNFYFGLNLKKNITCTAYIALNEQTEDQGGLGFYVGSHLRVFDHHKSDVIGFSSGIEKEDLKDFSLYTPKFEPGDLVLHHCNIVHEAKANNSLSARSNIAIRIFPCNPDYDLELKSKYQDFLSQSSRVS